MHCSVFSKVPIQTVVVSILLHADFIQVCVESHMVLVSETCLGSPSACELTLLGL